MSRGNAILLVLALVLLGENCSHCSYFEPDYDEVILTDEDINLLKNQCIPLGGNCNYYPQDECCQSLPCWCDPWKNCYCLDIQKVPE